MTKGMTIAVIDDEADMRDSITQWLSLSGFDAVSHESAEVGLQMIGADFPGVVISDIRMPGMDGMALLRRLQTVDPALPVILITGHGDVALAVEAMRAGAYDFVEKPFDPGRLADLARRATEARKLTLDNRILRRELADGSILTRKLIGSSAVMASLREDILDISQADGHVLVRGETGSGKSLIAHALHACGPRQGKPLIVQSCAALGPAELEAALFGMPGQDGPLPLFHQARTGTLCLDNIEMMPEAVQSRLLAELVAAEAGSADQTCRIISILSTDADGPEPMRQDLFFRLSALQITAPPLRERGEDILLLFTRFCQQFAEEYGCDQPELGASEAALLLQGRFPGNIRQLSNLAERAVLYARRGEGSLAQLLQAETDAGEGVALGQDKPLKDHVDAFEKLLIDGALRRHNGSVQAVIDELSIPRRTLNEKMAKYGLSRGDYVLG
jgi:DNA-binding NtrC family response regulator